MSNPTTNPSRPLLLALTGPTSSGKTTLATALAQIFPPPLSVTIHADDFYKPDSQIPVRGDGVLDWDCAGALDLVRFEEVLRGDFDGRRSRIVIVEGFLLVGESVRERIGGMCDVRVLLRAGREEARRRREGRNGYVTVEGFWEDPEGYFDEVVWPGYVREHGYLFLGGDVEGRVDEGRAREEGVCVLGLGLGLEEMLEIVVGEVRRALGDEVTMDA